jgi:Dolichyl-phosphate-mannose-protein mannosyltransferase
MLDRAQRRTGAPALRAVGIAIAFALGLHLRLADLDSQIVGGDELHSVYVALDRSWSDILSYYGPEDNSVPYTLYAKGLMQLDALDETTLRLPAIGAGALLMLAPMLFAREIGATAAAIAVALLATSLPAVFYSILARPYAPAALCLLLAVAAWSRWQAGSGRRAALGFAAFSALAVFLHLFCVFPLAALFAAALLRGLRDVRFRREAILALACTGLALLAGLGPGLPSLVATRAAKIGGTPLDLAFIGVAFDQLTGHLPALKWLLLALPIAGLAALQARAPALGRGVALALAAQALALVATRPEGGAGTWGRYFFLVWPLWLLATAIGVDAVIATASRRGQAARRESVALAAGLALALVPPLASPAALFRSKPSNFQSGKAMLQRLPPSSGAEPETWRTLLAVADRGDVLLVSPYVWKNPRWIALGELQRRVEMRIEMADARLSTWRARGVRYRNVVDLGSADEVTASGARYLLLDLEAGGDRLRDPIRARYGEPLAADAAGELYRLHPAPSAAVD